MIIQNTTKRSGREGGFAIGLILLAIVLIAAIVAAIAVSTQDSGSNSDREQNRIQASTLIQQGINLANAGARWTALGGRFNDDANIDFFTATIADPNTGTIDQIPSPPQESGFGEWRMFVVDSSPAANNVAASETAYAYLVIRNTAANNVTRATEVCAQINTILHSIQPAVININTIANSGAAAGEMDTNNDGTLNAGTDTVTIAPIVAGANGTGTSATGTANLTVLTTADTRGFDVYQAAGAAAFPAPTVEVEGCFITADVPARAVYVKRIAEGI